MLLGHTNIGTSNTNWVGNYVRVEAWLDVSGIANIFSIPTIKKLGYHITYDKDDRYYLVTNINTDVTTEFIENENVLPYVEATKEGVMFVQKVTQNYERFTNKEVENSVLSCEAPGLIGHTSEQDLKYLVSSNLDNCPVKILDLDNSRKMFRPILGRFRGKITRQNP